MSRHHAEPIHAGTEAERTKTISQKLYEIGARTLFIADSVRRNRFESATTEALNAVAESGSGTFIQIGGFDGEYDDPLFDFLEINQDWRGVVVEPQPEAAAYLKDKFAHRTGFIDVRNVAVLEDAEKDKEGAATLWRPVGSDGHALASFSRAHVQRALWKLSGPDIASKSTYTQLRVPAVSLAYIMEHAGFSNPDIFVTDTEGHDERIVGSLLSIARPRVLIFEHIDFTRVGYRRTLQVLKAGGYIVTKSHKDTLAVI